MKLSKPFCHIEYLADCPACGQIYEIGTTPPDHWIIVKCPTCETEFMIDEFRHH